MRLRCNSRGSPRTKGSFRKMSAELWAGKPGRDDGAGIARSTRANIRQEIASVTGGPGGSVDERAREMLRLRDEEHLTLREIAERYNLTPERVRQIVNRCRHRLQEDEQR
jgi:DNA-directed RNA polymerase sigma subunit (sigma70/sigma32)